MIRKSIVIFLASFLTFSCGTPSPPDQPDGQRTTEPGDTTASAVDSDIPEILSEQDFTLTENTLDQVLPEDIIQEIGFFGGLGGGGEQCIDFGYENPTFLRVIDQPYEWMQPVQITVCGLDPAEEVQIRVDLPDGTTTESTLIARQTEDNDKGEISFDYLPLPHSPVGRYVFTFAGNNWSLKYPLNIVEPLDSRLYIHESKLFLINFSPGESIRLFVYGSTNSGSLRLIGWKKYRVDESGDLQLRTDFKTSGYVAIGEITGQVSTGVEPADIYCKEAISPVGLIPNGYAEILVDSLQTYAPGLDGSWSEAGQIHPGAGTAALIASNAKCLDGKFLWYVSCTNNECLAWVPESGPDGPYLRPIEELPATATPEAAQIPVCPGTKPSRLQVEMSAEVTTSGMAPQLSLRALPGANAEQVHVIAAGRDLIILQGPVCADSSYWWYIRSEQGFEGWAREGDNEDYWIDPLP